MFSAGIRRTFFQVGDQATFIYCMCTGGLFLGTGFEKRAVFIDQKSNQTYKEKDDDKGQKFTAGA